MGMQDPPGGEQTSGDLRAELKLLKNYYAAKGTDLISVAPEMSTVTIEKRFRGGCSSSV